MKPEMTISRVHANEGDGHDDYMAIKVKSAEELSEKAEGVKVATPEKLAAQEDARQARARGDAKERLDTDMMAEHKKFVTNKPDRPYPFSEAFYRFAQGEMEREEQAEATERSDRMAAMLREELEKGETTGLWPPMAPPYEQEQEADYAEDLAAAHWKYVDSLLAVHGLNERTRAAIGFHYISAMVHGFKHGVEFAIGEEIDEE